MMGRSLTDEKGTEAGAPGVSVRGMGLLETATEFEKEKMRTRVTGRFGALPGIFSALSGREFSGYEIHMGKTDQRDDGFSALSNGRQDGAAKRAVLGSYVHGLFDSGDLAEKLMDLLLARKGLTAETARHVSLEDYKNQQYDALAAALRQSLDMELVYRILERGMEG